MAKGAVICALVLALAGFPATMASSRDVGSVDQARIEGADREPGNWLTHGRTYSEQRFSPLDQINGANIGRLGLAWVYDTGVGRAAEATPIVADGVMYVTSAWSIVHALDARTGRKLWVHDPEVDRRVAGWACCDAVNRGVALWKGRVYVATLDGRLVAIDARTGAPVWDVPTFEKGWRYTSTGAPRVAKGLVFIGNAGGEYGVRGYVSAYDAETGRLRWRFYTVPSDPAKGSDGAASDPQMAMAARTWTGEWWKYGGGGTVWDSIVYDPELDQLYIGVGNGSPWDRKVRSPGGGDNLFLSSIVALKPDTGAYLWHFQETPGETWDYTSTQPIVLATLKIGGRDRRVLMHAPKNGFFYVIDRATGKFVSGRNFVPMAKASEAPANIPISWAYGLDKDGRPLENAAARYVERSAFVTPSGFGAHNWQPMSYSPLTGLVYVPARRTYSEYASDESFVFKDGLQNAGNGALYGLGRPASERPDAARFTQGGYLLAWDPVAQKPAWERPMLPYHKNGGTLATAGGVVFWGLANGRLAAFDARNGARLWEGDTGLATVNAPISYAVDGVQYVAIMTGAALGAPLPAVGLMPTSRVLVYRLDGNATLPAYRAPAPMPAPPVITASAETVEQGARLFAQSCSACHGPAADSSGAFPDLRRSPAIQDADAFRAIVHGALAENGMPDFTNWIDAAQAEAIRAYVARRARDLYVAARKGA